MGIFGINFGGRKSVPAGSGNPAQTSSSSSGSWGWKPFKNMSIKIRRQSVSQRSDPKVDAARSTMKPHRDGTGIEPQPFNPNSKVNNNINVNSATKVETSKPHEEAGDQKYSSGKIQSMEKEIQSMRTIDFIEKIDDLVEATGFPKGTLYNMYMSGK
ncbi:MULTISPECIES: hypothetical protein [Alphaproteobacteria]|uniref:hypothetical protein n=1 Tax=Alphaproteobacteria TaxID=28211 RepID=UPI0032654D7A